MNKHQLSERVICTKFITPAMQQAFWSIYQWWKGLTLCDRQEKQQHARQKMQNNLAASAVSSLAVLTIVQEAASPLLEGEATK